jgi:tetratricopeptide (TPR) repeat protein
MTELLLGNAERAVTAAGIAVSLSPGYADYRNNLGEALLEFESFEMAIAEFEKAIEINVYYGNSYFNLGLARLSNMIAHQSQDSVADQVTQIADLFHRSSLLETKFRSQPYEEGISFLKGGMLGKALHILKCVREEKKNSHQSGKSLFQMKFLLYPDWVSPEVIDERIECLQEDLKVNPSYIDLHVELAQCYLEQARLAWEKGIRELRTTSELNPAIESVTSSLQQADTVHDDMLGILRPLMERG